MSYLNISKTWICLHLPNQFKKNIVEINFVKDLYNWTGIIIFHITIYFIIMYRILHDGKIFVHL